jgi:hypothetical protein
LRDAVRALGGDVDLNEQTGQLVYKFDEVEAEVQATEAGRAAASDEEARPGEVVFSSADEGVHFRDDRPVLSPSDSRQNVRPRPPQAGEGRGEGPRAIEEIPDRIPDAPAQRKDAESAEELLARLGVDTRRRGR